MAGVYDFMADLSQLKHNYEDYDTKRNDQYNNLKSSIKTTNPGYIEIPDSELNDDNRGYSNPEAISQLNANNGGGFMNSIKNMFNQKEAGGGSSNRDGNINVDDSRLADSSSSRNGNFVNNYGGMIGSAAGGLSTMFKKSDEFNSKQYRDEYAEKDENREKSVGSVKDTVASAVGPFGQMFRGIEKLGNSAGDSVGGAGGAMISSLFSPDETVMSMNSDPDVKTSDKIIGSILPLYGAVVNYNAKAKRKRTSMLDAIQNDPDATRREQEQRMKDGEQSLARLTELRKAQLNYIV